MALAVAGVPDEEIVADYVLTAGRLERIIDRLIEVEPYRRSLPTHTLEEQLPRAESMAAVLAHLDEEFGGTIGWLEAAGWTQEEVTRLRDRLVG